MKTNISKELKERRELASFLKEGDSSKIAKAAGVTRQAVDNWLRGKTKKSIIKHYVLAFVKIKQQEIDNDIEKVFQV